MLIVSFPFVTVVVSVFNLFVTVLNRVAVLVCELPTKHIKMKMDMPPHQQKEVFWCTAVTFFDMASPLLCKKDGHCAFM